MSFQIKNKDNVAIAINILDAEAAAFWGKQIHPKEYANPIKSEEGEDEITSLRRQMGTNWFDTIGYNIHQNISCYHKNCSKLTWKMVKESMMLVITDVLNPDPNQIPNNLDYWKDHFALIDHWEAKGYIPVTIND